MSILTQSSAVWGVPTLNYKADQTSFLPAAQNKAADQAGWTYDERGFWRNESKPGQYLNAGNVQGLLGKQTTAKQMMDPGSYNPGADYRGALTPFLGQDGSSTTTTGFGGQLRDLASDPNRIEDSNAYKFRFNQGQQALERSAAAKGMLNSGNTLAALAEYGQGMASQEYGNEFDRLLRASGQETQDRSTLASLMLDAERLKAQDYWQGQGMASDAAYKTGYITPAIW
jgi:hypothetical protein